MANKDPGSGLPDPVSQHKRNSELLDSFGGEPLEGSGFEEEIPEPDFEWKDPR